MQKKLLGVVIDRITNSIRFSEHSRSLFVNEEGEKLVKGIFESSKIFVAGPGSSGFMAKSFEMRMIHMGIDAYAC